MDLRRYMDDGANWQAQAVLAYLRSHYEQILDGTYSIIKGEYSVKLDVGRLENYREQGYVFSLRHLTKQRNFVIYEHRMADCICVGYFDMKTTNTPTFNEVVNGEASKSYYYTAYPYGAILECGKWLESEMKCFINEVTNIES